MPCSVVYESHGNPWARIGKLAFFLSFRNSVSERTDGRNSVSRGRGASVGGSCAPHPPTPLRGERSSPPQRVPKRSFGTRERNGIEQAGERPKAVATSGKLGEWCGVKSPVIHPGVRIGHVHLKVADLERALDFYRDVLGFEVTQRLGASAAFLSAGGYHHHIGLNTWESAGGRPPAAGTTGLFHVAILYPTRAVLGDALRRLIAAGIALDGAADHGVSEALYLRDPDGNGVELYWDRPVEEWPRTPDGGLAMFTKPLDLGSLLAAAESRG